jgi:biotin carboxyl carrier protein
VILEIGSGDNRKVVELSADGSRLQVAVDGKAVPCDWQRVAEGQYSLIVDGRVFDFIVEPREGHWHVAGRAGTAILQVRDPRRLSELHDVEEGQAGLQRLTSDMPGKVVRVLVREGEPVVYDQALLVLEAMKMQNEIRAPKSGVVREIGVTPGTAVGTGGFLLSLE